MAKKEVKTEKKATKDYLHEVTIKIDGETWKSALDNTFKIKQKDAKIDGFRKGKVPRDIYEKHFGKESLWLDAADSVLQQAYLQALTDSKLVPVVQPQVELKSLDDSGVEFNFKIITKPEVKIKKYKGLGVKPEEIKVEKEEIDHELEHLLERFAELKTKDGKVEKGNVAIIDFEGFKDGVAFDGGKGENYSLEIGSNTFIPGFEDGVIGMKSGEEKDIELTFPKDYAAKDLAGKKVTFKVKVNEVKEKVNRELDEDFFDDLGMKDVKNEKDLRAEIKKSIEEQKKLAAENAHIDALLEAVSKNVEVDIPEEMVNEEIHNLKHRFEHELSHQGLSLEMYYQFTNSTEDDLNAQLEKEAYQTTLYRLMLEEVRNLEKIEVTDEDVEKEAKELAEKYQMPKDEFVNQFGGMDAIRYDLEMNRTINKLKELNK